MFRRVVSGRKGGRRGRAAVVGCGHRECAPLCDPLDRTPLETAPKEARSTEVIVLWEGEGAAVLITSQGVAVAAAAAAVAAALQG